MYGTYLARCPGHTLGLHSRLTGHTTTDEPDIVGLGASPAVQPGGFVHHDGPDILDRPDAPGGRSTLAILETYDPFVHHDGPDIFGACTHDEPDILFTMYRTYLARALTMYRTYHYR